MPEHFEVGKPCVCIESGPWTLPTAVDPYGLTKHEKVMVSEIEEFEGLPILKFEEYSREAQGGGCYMYDSRLFRPMDDCDFGGFRLDIYADEHDRLEVPAIEYA